MAGSWQVFDDLDQVRELIARYDSDHERDILHHGRFRYAIQHADGTRAQLARVRSSPAMRIRGTPRAFLVHVLEDGRTTYRVGDRVFEASPGRAVLLAPGQLFTSWSSGGTTLAFRVEEAALREEAAALSASESPEQLSCLSTRRPDATSQGSCPWRTSGRPSAVAARCATGRPRPRARWPGPGSSCRERAQEDAG